MEKEQEKDWQLQRLYVVLFFNALIWFTILAFVSSLKETVVFIIAMGVIGVTSTWQFIAHIIVCRKKLELKPMLMMYAAPFILMGACLPFLPILKPDPGIQSPNKAFYFNGERGPNFWELKFKNEDREIVEIHDKMLPSNKHLNWKWDSDNRLWIYSKLDKLYYFFVLTNGKHVPEVWSDEKFKFKPPEGMTD